jgi:UTP--glucose-1-phosphate uridylyltransferase
MLKLNGGLGTGMGLDKAKALLAVKANRSFLEVVIQHVLYCRRENAVDFPLLLMNSFRTEEDTLKVLAHYPDLAVPGLPLSFVQHQVPRIRQDNLGVVDWPENPQLEWCPPGHGNIYVTLADNGLLEQMLDLGYKYAYVSNIDNMGSLMNLKVLGYFASRDISFMMEVTDRKAGDAKGGHLGRYQNGRWMLRELAQCPLAELEKFQDHQRHRYFNTNNIWWNLPRLWQTLKQHNFILELPVICNAKKVDPDRSDSPSVYQLETAIGAALEVFSDSVVLKVPRDRQIPVKHWSELIVLRSDAFVTGPDGRLLLNPQCNGQQPLVKLDERFYKSNQDISTHFPEGLPSLVHCRTLTIEGNVIFGKNVAIRGDVAIVVKNSDFNNHYYIPSDTILRGSQVYIGS